MASSGTPSDRTEFQKLLREAEDQLGQSKDVADALGLQPPSYSRAKKNGTMNAEGCLRLAKLVGRNPSQVLRVARKADVATLIEDVYGITPATATRGMSAEQIEAAEVGREYLALAPQWRAHVRAELQLMAAYGGRARSTEDAAPEPPAATPRTTGGQRRRAR